MRRRQSRATSTLLNLAGIALVLPGCGLALYFVAVDHLARHTLGEWADSLWAALDWLPSPELMPFGIIAVLLAAGVLLCAMVWLPWLTPCLVLSTGVASVAYILWAVGLADIATNPLLWLSLMGIGLGVWQLARLRSLEPVGNLTRRA
jgi:hypothetical protein